MEPITERQAAVLAFIRSSVGKRGYAPTHAEICAEFGWSSVATAYGALRRLEEAGRIRRVPHQRRGIEVVDFDRVIFEVHVGEPGNRRAFSIAAPRAVLDKNAEVRVEVERCHFLCAPEDQPTQVSIVAGGASIGAVWFDKELNPLSEERLNAVANTRPPNFDGE